MGNVVILEPAMLISDSVLALACLYCYIDIKSKTKYAAVVSKYWGRFFLFEAISFFVGGIAHGFYLYLGDMIHLIAWYASIIGLFYFTWGMVTVTKNNKRKNLFVVLLAGMIICVALTAWLFNFSIIIIYCFMCMYAVILINRKEKIISFKNPYSKGILIGTGLFLSAAAVFVFKFSVLFVESGVISHILITVGILFFGKGCLETILTLSDKDNDFLGEKANIQSS